MAKLIDTTVYGDLVSTLTISAGTVLYVPNGTGINEFSIDGTLAGNSDDALPTEKAVKTYADAIETTSNNISAASREQDNRLQENIDVNTGNITTNTTNIATNVTSILSVSAASWEQDNRLQETIDALTTDHGELVGLEDDDHEQYLLIDGTRGMTGSLLFTGLYDAYIKGDTKDGSDNSNIYLEGAGTNLSYVTSKGTGATSEGRFIAKYGSGLDNIQMYHNGTNGYIRTDAGDLYLTPSGGFKDVVINGGDLKFDAYNGISMLNAKTGSDYCLFIGGNTGSSVNRGTRNTAVGWNNLYNNVNGSYNTTFGMGCLTQCTSGWHNTAIGDAGLAYTTTGSNNFAIGSWAIFQNKTGNHNIGIGVNSLRNVKGSYNVGIGGNIGYHGEVESDHWTSSYNTFVGNSAANRIQSDADENTFIGYQAGYYLTRGSNNILIGSQAGKYNVGTGSNNILIGTGTDLIIPSGSDELNIGDLIYGDLSSDLVGIGENAPLSILHVSKASASYWTAAGHLWGATTEPPQALTIENTTNSGYDPVMIFRQNTSTGVGKTAGAIGMFGAENWDNSNLAAQVSKMYFVLRDTAGVLQQRMLIDHDGKVGINTNSPGRALDVIGEGIGITGFFNPQSSAGMVFSHQNSWNRAEIAYYDDSTWTTVMQFSDGEAAIDLAFGNVEGYIGVNKIASNYFKGSSGTTISEFSIDGTLAGNSDDAVPTEKAVKTYSDSISAASNERDTRLQETLDATNVIAVSAASVEQDNRLEEYVDSEVRTDEEIDDRVSNLLTAGNNIQLTYDDGANSLEISAAHLRGEGGIISIANGVSTKTVTFDTSAADTNYAVSISLSNEIDVNPSMYGMTVTEKTTEGFTVTFSGVMDSANYILDWAVNQKNVPTNTQYNTMPAGAVVSWVTSAAPDGWLECDGSAVSRTSYDTLFNVIGEQFGNGDGSTTFNLPDLRGEFLRGWDHDAGNDPDAADRTARGDGVRADHVGSEQADEFDEHRHSYGVYQGAGDDGGNYVRANDLGTRTGYVGYTGGNETRPRNIYVMWIIKYTTAALGLTTDHGDLIGLGDDDHTQYPLADGSRTFTFGGCSVKMSGTQTVTTSTWEILEMDTEVYDTLGEYDTGTYRYTAKHEGVYICSLCTSVDAVADAQSIGAIFKKNGAWYGPEALMYIGKAATVAVNTTAIVKLDVDDYMEGYIWHTHGSDRNAANTDFQNIMQIQRVS